MLLLHPLDWGMKIVVDDNKDYLTFVNNKLIKFQFDNTFSGFFFDKGTNKRNGEPTK